LSWRPGFNTHSCIVCAEVHMRQTPMHETISALHLADQNPSFCRSKLTLASAMVHPRFLMCQFLHQHHLLSPLLFAPEIVTPSSSSKPSRLFLTLVTHHFILCRKLSFIIGGQVQFRIFWQRFSRFVIFRHKLKGVAISWKPQPYIETLARYLVSSESIALIPPSASLKRHCYIFITLEICTRLVEPFKW